MKKVSKHQPVFIFDLDDTLYKEIDFVKSAYRHIDRLLVADYGTKPREAYKRLIKSHKDGVNPFDTLNEYLTAKGIIIPDAIEWMVTEYRYHVPSINLEENTRLTLDSIRDHEIPMYIITDGRSITQRNKIRALGLTEYIPWENIYISEDEGRDKLSPMSFRKIRERESCNAMENEFVFVGDNPAKDFVVANRYGCLSIQLTDDGRNIHPQNIQVAKEQKAKRHIRYFKELNDFVNLYQLKFL